MTQLIRLGGLVTATLMIACIADISAPTGNLRPWDGVAVGTSSPEDSTECPPPGGEEFRANDVIAAVCEQPEECADWDANDIMQEYHDYAIYPKPQCHELTHGFGTAHFSWDDYNGRFMQGNPHFDVGWVTNALRNGAENTRYWYGKPIYMESGYRCPHGNFSLPGASRSSRHMRGTATDLYDWALLRYWNRDQFNELKFAAEMGFWVESFTYDTYADRHYHVAFM